jgi:hypothetical protein
MVVAILTIFLGALGTAAGLQELVVQGIGNNQTIPLTGGTLGAVSGALTLSAGIALLCQARRAIALARAAALAGLVVALLIGKIVWGLAGWPMTIAGLGWSLFLLVYLRNPSARLGAR